MPGDSSTLISGLTNLWGIVMMALLLGGSIFVHELGHFLAAKWRGLVVDRFSIGFGPKLFGWKGRDGVEYVLSLLPLGGYVLLPQLADLRELEGEPSHDARDLPPINYADKMVVAVAGVIFNIGLAFALACVLWIYGIPTTSALESNILGYVPETIPGLPGKADMPDPAYAAGLRPGDSILAIDGKKIRNFRDLQEAIALGAGRDASGHPLAHITYSRDGVTHDVDVLPVLHETNEKTSDAIRQIGVDPSFKLIVGRVQENSPAQLAGIKENDQILSVNGQTAFSDAHFIQLLDAQNGKPVTLKVQRPGINGADAKTFDVTVQSVNVPRTTPLATLRVSPKTDGGAAATVDFLPIYPRNSKDNPALSTATASELVVWKVKGDARLLGGLTEGDTVAKVNSVKPASIQEMVNDLASTPDGIPARITFLESGQSSIETASISGPFEAKVTPPKEKLMIGIGFRDEVISVYPTPWRQFSDAFGQTFSMLSSLVNPHSDVGIGMLSGAVGMGRALQRFSVDDFRLALWFTMLINISLAVLNLLPIPVLDGGHMVLATIGQLRGKALPAQFIVATQSVFIVLLMGLMLYVVYNDSRRWIGDNQMEREDMRAQIYNLDIAFPAPNAAQAPAAAQSVAP